MQNFDHEGALARELARGAESQAFLRRCIERELSDARSAITSDDPQRPTRLREIELRERNMLYAQRLMEGYFEDLIERRKMLDRDRTAADRNSNLHFLLNTLNLARSEWFYQFLRRIDAQGRYHPYPRLRISWTTWWMDLQRDVPTIDQLQAENEQLRERLAAVGAADPEDDLDEFIVGDLEYADVDAQAEDRGEEWVRKKREEFATKIPDGDPTKVFQVKQYEKSRRKRMEAALAAWRLRREQRGGETHE